MADDIEQRMQHWLTLCQAPDQDPLQGMAAAGLFAPPPDYATIAGLKAAFVQHTGLLGVGGIGGGRHLVGRHFIEGFGTAEQKATWLGQAISVAISEPDVGAHPKLLRTTATETADGFRITGEKAWVSNGPNADAIIVVAITSEEAGRKRYSAFLVPRETPGLTMTDMPGFHALRPSRHCRLLLDNCLLPTSALLGPLGVAYERMAMPFRDVEDAVGTFGTLGAFRYLSRRLAEGGSPSEARSLSLGTLLALTAVFEAGARDVVATLDAGRLDSGSAVLAGLRVLASDLLARAKTHVETHGPVDSPAIQSILDDLGATLGIARGPRMARLVRLGEGAISA